MGKGKLPVDDGDYVIPENQRILMSPDELATWVVRGGGMPEGQKPKDVVKGGSSDD